jgi:hypothetical protein
MFSKASEDVRVGASWAAGAGAGSASVGLGRGGSDRRGIAAMLIKAEIRSLPSPWLDWSPLPFICWSILLVLHRC